MDLPSWLANFRQSKWLPWLLLGLCLTVLLGLALWLGWVSALLNSSWFWVTLVLFFALAAYSAVQWGFPWLRRRRFLEQPGSAYIAAGEASPEEVSAKFAAAIQALRSLPRLASVPDPLRALPWYLAIGPSGSGKTAALRESGGFSSIGGSDSNAPEGPTQNFRWWVANDLVVIDTAGRYAFPNDVSRDRGEWYHLLHLLHEQRREAPINGLIVTVGMDEIVSSTDDELRAAASKLRERIEETIKELGADPPIYVLVTKCDILEGFSSFFSALPERIRGEVLGYVDEGSGKSDAIDAAKRGAPALARVQSGLKEIAERLHLFRLAILDSKLSPDRRPDVFCFPEELRGIFRPLMSFLEPICNEDVRFTTPLLRGLFLVSSLQDGSSASPLRAELGLAGVSTPGPVNRIPHFLRDVFATMLPRDRWLLRTTRREIRRRRLGSATRIGLAGLLALLFTTLAVREYQVDRAILSSVDPGACAPSPSGSIPSRRLANLDRCREAAQSLTDQGNRRRRWFPIGFNRSGEQARALRSEFIHRFHEEIVVPGNADLERALHTAGDPLPLLVFLAKRVHVGRLCNTPTGCREPPGDDVLPNPALMLAPGADRHPTLEDAGRMKAAYVAFLGWQAADTNILTRDLDADQARLQQALAGSHLSLDRLVQWANRSHPPVTLETYWELPNPVVGSPGPIVEAAYTREVWDQEISPLLQQVQDAVPDATPQLQAFTRQYRAACLTQWHTFLEAFPTGAERWKGADRRKALAQLMLGDKSPTLRVLDDASRNISSLSGSDTDSEPPPPWARTLASWPSSDQKRSFVDALGKIASQLDHGDWSEGALKIARETFADGVPSGSAKAAMLQASWNAGPASPAGATEQGPSDDVSKNPATPLLRQSVGVIWSAVLDAAATRLQQAWSEDVVAQLRGLPTTQQAASLLEPGGKLATFIDQSLLPFLSPEDLRPRPLLGQSLPLSPNFLQLLAKSREMKSIFEGDGTEHPVQVRAERASEIEGRSDLVEEQTVLSIACAGKAYRVTNRPQAGGTDSTIVPWSYRGCTAASITVYLTDHKPGADASIPGASPLQITRRYSGQAAPLDILHDLSVSPRHFTLEEFAGSEPEADTLARRGVTGFKLFYRLEAPGVLNSLVAALEHFAPPSQIASPVSS